MEKITVTRALKKVFSLVPILAIVSTIFFSLIYLTLSFTMGCVENSSDEKLRIQTEDSMKEMNAQIGMPAIKNFQERKLAKMIFELRDQENLICYAYIVNQMKGELVFIGKCLGFGLPYSVQYTNPMKRRSRLSNAPPIPQADPNGLFMPNGLSATWLMMVDRTTGETRPVYIEPQIIVSPFPLHDLSE